MSSEGAEETPWPDGDVVAIAWYVVFNYSASWDQLSDVDPGLDLDEIALLLQQLRQAGHAVGPDGPRRLSGGEEVRGPVRRLVALIEAVRRAAAVAFAGPGALLDQIWATCRWPRTYLALPPAALTAPEQVELLHLGDLPPQTEDWQQRARVIDYPALRALTLFNDQLGRHPFGITLSRLPRLQYLDLRDNHLTAVPAEVTGCRSLQHLDLSGNPVTELAGVELLPELRYLGLGSTAVDRRAVARLQRLRPELVIDR